MNLNPNAIISISTIIVIPKAIQFWKVEECLFEFKNEDNNKDVVESGLWGQHDIGYDKKTWNKI